MLKKLSKTTGSDGRKEITSTILSGGYPEPALVKSSEVRHRWFDSYRQTYLERDLLSIKSIENIPDFNRLLSLMAFRTGGLLNLSDLSRETRLPFTTLRRYMSLLEVTYQVFLLTPYHANIGKRLVKTPKLFMNDTGMACYLRGADDWSALEHQGQVGSMVKTWAKLAAGLENLAEAEEAPQTDATEFHRVFEQLEAAIETLIIDVEQTLRRLRDRIKA